MPLIEVDADEFKRFNAEFKLLKSKLDAIREVLYERFGQGKCGALSTVGLIEKIVREAHSEPDQLTPDALRRGIRSGKSPGDGSLGR